MLKNEKGLFELFYSEYRQAQTIISESSFDSKNEEIPDGFATEYATWLNDEKMNYASKMVKKKVNHLVFTLYPKAERKEQQDYIIKVQTKAKEKHGIPIDKDFIGHQGLEKIYVWLLDRIAHAKAKKIKGTEEL